MPKEDRPSIIEAAKIANSEVIKALRVAAQGTLANLSDRHPGWDRRDPAQVLVEAVKESDDLKNKFDNDINKIKKRLGIDQDAPTSPVAPAEGQGVTTEVKPGPLFGGAIKRPRAKTQGQEQSPGTTDSIKPKGLPEVRNTKVPGSNVGAGGSSGSELPEGQGNWAGE